MDHSQATRTIKVEITWRSVLRVLAGVLLGYVAVVLWPFARLLLLSILLAVALYPMVNWAQAKGAPRGTGVLLAAGTLGVLVLCFFAILGPMALHQAVALGDNLPELRQRIISQLPANGLLRTAMENAVSMGTVADSRVILERTVALVQMTVGGLVEFAVVICVAVYLIADGPAALAWLIVFFPAAQRQSILAGLKEFSGLIFAYVSGQFLISALCAAYMFVLLKLLGVPMALLVGIIAGLCDILPIVGFIVTVCLATAMGLTISLQTVLLIFVL